MHFSLTCNNIEVNESSWHDITQWRTVHWENLISNSFHIEWDMIVVMVFLLILNQMEIHLVLSRKENRHHDHIPLNVRRNRILVSSVYVRSLVVTLGSNAQETGKHFPAVTRCLIRTQMTHSEKQIFLHFRINRNVIAIIISLYYYETK